MNKIYPVEQKLVPFNGAELLGIKSDDGKIHIGVSYVCNGIGLSEKQRDRQVSNIQEDIVLKQGANKLPLKFGGQVREVLVIDLDFLPLWLAKISITPSMQKNQPEIAQKLISYQLKAKEVLAAAFIHNQHSYMISDPVERARKWIEEQVEKQELQSNVLQLEQRVKEVEPKVAYYDIILKSKGTVTTSQVAKDYGLSGTQLNSILKEQGIQFKQNGQWLLYSKHANKGYTQSHSFEVTHKDGTKELKMNTRWTQRGRIMIHQILTELGIKPNIEKEYDDAK